MNFKAIVKGLKSIIRCDLQERPIIELLCTENAFTDNIKGFGINTYILQFDN